MEKGGDRVVRPVLMTAALAAALAVVASAGCGARGEQSDPVVPGMVPGAAWRSEAPVGHAGDGARRNLAAGESFRFGGLRIDVVATGGTPAPEDDPVSAASRSIARLALSHGPVSEELEVAAGAAVRWGEYRIAVLSVRGEGELGAGLVELEVATLASLPAHIAASDTAGGAEMRLRIPHRITHVTLHHTGSPEPLRPGDDPVERLRGLQRWGRTDRNWWDVPYHYLIDLEGRIYEGRDWRYMGETNTAYDPAGHFLISVIGNYGVQEPTPAQLEAITDLMAWAVSRFDIPLDRIGGHYDYAPTTCPGTHLRKYLEDGTLRRGVKARLDLHP
jgi:hypothetical protein